MPVKNIIPGQRVTKAKLERAKELRREMTPAEKLLWQLYNIFKRVDLPRSKAIFVSNVINNKKRFGKHGGKWVYLAFNKLTGD